MMEQYGFRGDGGPLEPLILCVRLDVAPPAPQRDHTALVAGTLLQYSRRVATQGPASWCDASAHRTRTASGLRLATAISSKLTARGVRAAVGVGSNRVLAAMAAGCAPCGGSCRLTRAAVPSCIWPLPLDHLWGLSRDAIQIGLRCGLRTIGDLAALGPVRAGATFGTDGWKLWLAAYGRNDEAVPLHDCGPHPEIAVEQGLDPGETTASGGMLALLAASERMSHRLRCAGLVAAGLHLRVDPGGTSRQAALNPPTDRPLDLFRVAVQLGAPGCTAPAAGCRVLLKALALEPAPPPGP